MLNLHPEVSCPSEQNFDSLLKNLGMTLGNYEQGLRLIDRRTGGQGIVPLGDAITLRTFRFVVENIIYQSAGDKPVAGANDNAIIWKLDFYTRLFDSPRFIVIFRNPIDMAVSAWHHNHRLAREENNKGHLEIMTRHGDFDGWVKFYAETFVNAARACTNYAAEHGNMMIIRYEDLKNDKHANLIKLFEFLAVSTEEGIIDGIVNNSSLEAMRSASVNKEFFRSGSTDMGKGEVSEELRKEVSRIVSPMLQALGYEIDG